MNLENMQKQPVEQPKKPLPVQIIEDAINSGDPKEIEAAEIRVKDLQKALKEKGSTKEQASAINQALLELGAYREKLGRKEVKVHTIRPEDVATDEEMEKILKDSEPQGRA